MKCLEDEALLEKVGNVQDCVYQGEAPRHIHLVCVCVCVCVCVRACVRVAWCGVCLLPNFEHCMKTYCIVNTNPRVWIKATLTDM